MTTKTMAIKPNHLLNRIKMDDHSWFANLSSSSSSLIDECNQIVQQKYHSSLMHLCAQYDSFQTGYLLLVNHADHQWLYKRDLDGKTPLHTACTFGSNQIASIFIKNQHIVNDFKRGDWTALMISIAKQNINLVKLLLNNQADDLVEDKNGWTALHLAVRTGNIELIKLLMDQKPKDWWPKPLKNGRNIMHIAAINGHILVFEMLANYLSEINQKELINYADNCGVTPFMDASCIDCIPIMEIVLAKIHDISTCLEHLDDCHRNILHHCAQTNSYTTIQFLINHNSLSSMIIQKNLINQCDEWGQTPIFLAIRDGHYESVQLLLQLGSRIDIQDSNDRTPVDICQQYKHDHLLDLFENLMI